MALHRAVGCDTDGCLALYVAAPQSGPDAALYAAHRAGWDVSKSALFITRCPACCSGGPVVSERGDCPVCMGATYDGRHGEVCHFCGHLTPHTADEDDDGPAAADEDQVQHDHGQEDGEQLAAAAPEGSDGR